MTTPTSELLIPGRLAISIPQDTLLILETMCATAQAWELAGFATVDYRKPLFVVRYAFLLSAGDPQNPSSDSIASIASHVGGEANLRVWWHRHSIGDGRPGPHNWSASDEEFIARPPIPSLNQWLISVVRTPLGWVGRLDDYRSKVTIHMPVIQLMEPKLHRLVYTTAWQLRPREETPAPPPRLSTSIGANTIVAEGPTELSALHEILDLDETETRHWETHLSVLGAGASHAPQPFHEKSEQTTPDLNGNLDLGTFDEVDDSTSFETENDSYLEYKRKERIVAWLARSRYAKVSAIENGFEIGPGITARRANGLEVDLFSWLISEGFGEPDTEMLERFDVAHLGQGTSLQRLRFTRSWVGRRHGSRRFPPREPSPLLFIPEEYDEFLQDAESSWLDLWNDYVERLIEDEGYTEADGYFSSEPNRE
jgi:hypothetical protein